MGRLSTLANDAGTTGLGGYFSSFGTGYGEAGCQSYMQAYRPTRMDNMVYYKTPTFAGTEVWLLYGMGDEATGTVENESSRDRYYGAAVTYNNGGLSLYGAVDVLNKATYGVAVEPRGENQVTVTAAVNYDCGFAKSYLGVHWFDNAKAVGSSSSNGDWARMSDDLDDGYRYGDATGWSVMAGVDVPAAGGLVKAPARKSIRTSAATWALWPMNIRSPSAPRSTRPPATSRTTWPTATRAGCTSTAVSRTSSNPSFGT